MDMMSLQGTKCSAGVIICSLTFSSLFTIIAQQFVFNAPCPWLTEVENAPKVSTLENFISTLLVLKAHLTSFNFRISKLSSFYVQELYGTRQCYLGWMNNCGIFNTYVIDRAASKARITLYYFVLKKLKSTRVREKMAEASLIFSICE